MFILSIFYAILSSNDALYSLQLLSIFRPLMLNYQVRRITWILEEIRIHAIIVFYDPLSMLASFVLYDLNPSRHRWSQSNARPVSSNSVTRQ